MNAILISNFLSEASRYNTLINELSWDDRAGNRKECFMAFDTSMTYSYGKHEGVRRVYIASEMHPLVAELCKSINKELRSSYNICVLNYYENEYNSLGWHADDSPEQDPTHPIAVMSFGASRYIYTRPNGYKGVIPPEDMFLLTPGSLFIMPPGFQETHQHKIPKHSSPCGKRISMTFRKLDR